HAPGRRRAGHAPCGPLRPGERGPVGPGRHVARAVALRVLALRRREAAALVRGAPPAGGARRPPRPVPVRAAPARRRPAGSGAGGRQPNDARDRRGQVTAAASGRAIGRRSMIPLLLFTGLLAAAGTDLEGVRGVVTDGDGKPVRGALVVLFRSERGEDSDREQS